MFDSQEDFLLQSNDAMESSPRFSELIESPNVSNENLHASFELWPGEDLLLSSKQTKKRDGMQGEEAKRRIILQHIAEKEVMLQQNLQRND